MRFGFCIMLTLILLSPGIVWAQALGELGDTSTFSLSASPQYPAPYGKATLSFLSNSLDLANATVSVSVDAKNIYQGSVQPVAVTLGKAGSITNVVATISSHGTNYSQSLRIQPQDVTLVAEPISSAPPLYSGKSLVPLEGNTRVVAIANLRDVNGISLKSSSLSYAWTVDTTYIANSSGIGKQAIIVASPLQYRARDVSVAVMSQDGSLVGGASLSLIPEEPSIRVYENDPLLGIRYDHALLNSYSVEEAESTFYAAPFSLPTTNGSPFLQWFLDGAAVQTGTSITLRPTGSGQGSASLSLVASAGNYTTATTYISLTFGAPARNNFFGL